jgi:hypothetical protein
MATRLNPAVEDAQETRAKVHAVGLRGSSNGSDILQDANRRQTLASQGCCLRGRPAGR